jgi:hypothetical protein
MIGTKKSGIALAMGLLLATPVAFGQAQTKESAHAFLASVINKGQTKWYDLPYLNYEGSDCNSRLVAQRSSDGKKRVNVSIDWSNVSSVVNGTNSQVYVNGVIFWGDEVWQNTSFYPGSTAMRDRFAVAFEFLRVQCDKTKQFGF